MEGYQSLWRSQVEPAFGRVRLDRIDRLNIEGWIAAMKRQGLSPSRIRQAHQLLNALLKSAVESRHLASNPAQGVKLPRTQPREQLFLTPSEVMRLADEIASPYGIWVVLMSATGLRWGEAAALKRGRVDIPRRRLTVAESLATVNGEQIFGTPKNHQTRTIVLPNNVRDLLNDHIVKNVAPNPAALVFSSPQGMPLRHTNFTRSVWKPAVVQAGLPEKLRIHDLRHTAAALLIASGAHPEAIKRQLGHSSITVTMDRYGHLFPSNADALADGVQALIEREVDTSWTPNIMPMPN